jgi:hypothetical protein
LIEKDRIKCFNSEMKWKDLPFSSQKSTFRHF